MVEFFTFDPSFTSWTPSTQEFQSFTENNKYYNGKATKDSSAASKITLAPAPVHAYALTMTKRVLCTDHNRHCNSVSYTMEETRTEVERHESKCPICAVEMKEREFLLTYQRLKEASKVVRNLCMRREHPDACHLCTKHRPYEPNDGIPRCVNDSYNWRRDTPRVPNGRHMTPLPDYPVRPVNDVAQRMFQLAEQLPATGYQFGMTIGSVFMRKPKPVDTVDYWFNYYTQPNVYTARMDYTQSFDKPNEKEEENKDNFPSKRMAAKFDINNVKPANM